MEHEAVFELAGQRVDALRVAFGAQRGDHQRLRLAAREQRGAVRAGQNGVADLDGAHGARVAAVDAGLAGQDLAAHDLGFDVEQEGLDLHRVEIGAFGLERLQHGSGRLAQGLRAGLLAADLVGGAQLLLGQLRDLGDEGLVLGGGLPVPHGLAGVAHQFMDGVDGDAALLVAEHHGAQHDVFGQLLRLGLDHQHGGFGAGDDQVHLRVLAGGLARVQHVFAVDVAHARGADRAVERNAGHRQGRAHGDHGRDVGIDLGVQRHGVDDHVDFVVEAFGEQRADRAVDQAAGQRLEFAGLGFALEEAAGDLAGGIRLLDVVHRQGKKSLAGLGGLGGDDRGQHDRVVDVDQHGAGGLAGDLARFHDDGLVAPLERFRDLVEHAHGCSIRVWPARKDAGGWVDAAIQNTMPFQRPCLHPAWRARAVGMTQLRSAIAASEVENA